MLKLAYDGSVMSPATISRWDNGFAEGRESIQEEQRRERLYITKSNELTLK